MKNIGLVIIGIALFMLLKDRAGLDFDFDVLPPSGGDAIDQADEEVRQALADYFRSHDFPENAQEESQAIKDLREIHSMRKEAFESAATKWSEGDGEGSARDLEKRRVR